MEYIKRCFDLKTIISRKSMFLFGPRQTGKTSYIKNQLLKDVDVGLLGVSDLGEYLGEVAGAVLAHHLLVEGEVLAYFVDAVDVVVAVVVVDFAVHDAFQR